MMRFPLIEQLSLPCTFERLVPGKLYADGRRYLPLIVLRFPAPLEASNSAQVTALGVTDRHHVVDPSLVSRAGAARLVFLLSTIRLQTPPYRSVLVAENELAADHASTAPTAYGQVLAVPAWEAERAHLPYESLYTELLLDIGSGVVGVRTSITAASLAEAIGKAHIAPGDWLEVRRSRIDILGFEAT